MALFGRKQPDIDSVPQEVQDYYQSERRERTGVAWLLALATLVVTLLLAIGLFYGGRWVYRTAFKNDSTPTATQTATSTTASVEVNNTDDQQSSSTDTDTATPTASPSPSSSPASTSSPSPTPAATNATSTNSSTALVNTGPGDALTVFVVATIAGITAYRMVWVRGTNRSR